MPTDFVFKTMNSVHRGLLKFSGGRYGWTAGKMPAVELTTTGRKSGLPQTTMLTSPWQDGDTMALVASAGGNDQNPAWFLNLTAEPSVMVRTGDGVRAMTARVATSDERAELWPKIVAKYKNYGGYQAKTDREIPIVLLEPDTA